MKNVGISFVTVRIGSGYFTRWQGTQWLCWPRSPICPPSATNHTPLSPALVNIPLPAVRLRHVLWPGVVSGGTAMFPSPSLLGGGGTLSALSGAVEKFYCYVITGETCLTWGRVCQQLAKEWVPFMREPFVRTRASSVERSGMVWNLHTRYVIVDKFSAWLGD